jgi:DNA-binding NarL/FixJ family response regulator
VRIHSTNGNLDAAEGYAKQLEQTATDLGTGVLRAIADHAWGTVLSARDEPREALSFLQRAEEVWQRVRAPYAHAQTVCAMGMACRRLGDVDGGTLALRSAAAEFERLGARADLDKVRKLLGDESATPADVSPRELEVLRLVATGRTSKDIAGELGLSVKTIDRHLSNLFVKLNVSSRAEATAYAYKKGLVQS